MALGGGGGGGVEGLRVEKLAARRCSARTKSFHESVKSVFLLPPIGVFCVRAGPPPVAILPSALFFERFSLGASWASSLQQVLLPDNRPRLPSLRRELG